MRAWYAFLNKLEKNMGEAIVKKWLHSIKILKFDACNLYLEVIDKFHFNWFEEHVKPKIKGQLVNNNNSPVKVHLSIKNHSYSKNTFSKTDKKPFFNFEIIPNKIDKTYDLSSFHISDKNSLLFNFISKLIKTDVKEDLDINLSSFNPIYICGAEGSGKTHLLMALAQALKNLKKNVFFVTAQTFTQHVVNSIRSGLLHNFRKIYRHIDVLIIDDIHQLKGRSATQEEFFHTFNVLHTQGNQIILSSNVVPSALKDIEKRLVSRFEWGIMLSLEKSDNQILKHILENKIKKLELSLNTEIKSYLLETFASSKSLNKALQALILRFEDKQLCNLTLCDVKNKLSDIIIEQKKVKLTSSLIIDIVAKYFGICFEDIIGKAQAKEYSFPRQIAMFICREKLKFPYKKIGKIFNRDHSTVMTNIKYIQKKKDEKIKDVFFALLQIEKKLKL